MAIPATRNIKIYRGDTEIVNVTITSDGTTPVDVTGRTYTAQVRYTVDAASPAATFSCVITNAAAGQVQLTLSSAATTSLTAGTAYWDFQETNGSVVSTLIAGKCTILPDVTR